MKLKFIGKTKLSNSGDCPALYKTDRGTYVVQGYRVPQDVEGVRDLGENERLVEVPADVIEEIARRV